MRETDNRRPGQQPGPEFAHLKRGRARAAFRAAGWAALNGFAPAAVAAAVFAVTSRYLSPAEFGLVALAAGITMFVSAFGPGGFGEALVQRTDIEARHLNAVFWLCLGAGVLLYGVLFLAAPLLGNALGEDGLPLLIAVLATRVVFDMAAVVPNALLARSMSFDKLAIRATAASLAGAAVCLALLLLGYGLWALAISQLTASVAAYAGAQLSVGWRPALAFDRRALREVMRYGAFASGHRIVQMVSVDQLLVGVLMGTTALGIFSFARRIHQLLGDLAAGALKSVSFTVLSSMQHEQDKLREAYFFATFAASSLSFPIFAGLAAVAPDFVPLVFGAHWSEAVPALRGFCVLGLLTCVGLLQSALINSQGRVSWWLCYQLAQQAGTALVVLLVHPYGIDAVVYAFVAKTVLLWPVAVTMSIRLLRTGLRTYLAAFAAPAAASLAMLVAVAVIRVETAGYAPAASLCLQVAGGAAVYGMALLGLARRRMVHAGRLLLASRTVTP